jgi:salicylaldehyde dehydrogenase
MVEDAVSKGARIVLGGAAQGAFMAATILDGVTAPMDIYHEEAFGPVVAIVRARDAEDALRIANDTKYGLAGAIFSRDILRALEFAMRMEAGHCHVNAGTVQGEPQAPYGGMKASGYGRFDGGRAVIEEFTELRWITVASRGQQYPF